MSKSESNPMAKYYDRIWHEKLSLPQYSTLERRWRSRWDFCVVKIRDRSKVLDAGCGDGVLGEFLIHDKKCEVFGLDITEYPLSLAKEKGVKVCLCDISVDTFPYEDNVFNAVVLSCVLEHIMHPEHALLEAKRVVKPGGWILVTLPNVAYIKNRIGILFGHTPLDFQHLNPGEGMHLRFFNYRDEFEKYVLNQVAGLKIIWKKADLKNPKKYSPFRRGLLLIFIKLMPNMFGQYTHFILEKEG